MNLFKSTKATTYISSRGDKVYPIIMDIKTGIVEGDAVFTTGDIDTAYLYATILEEQSDYNILGSTVICNIQRPDGTTMKVQGDVLGNNLIEFPLGQSGVSQEGIYNFDIAVVFSEKKMVTSPTAQYSVTQSIEVIGEIEEDDRFPVLESLISGINVINEEELVRVSNEEVRQSKEEAREQAESVRARNEEIRLANNEAIRNEEAVRVVNENERKNAESLRVQEENKRKQQENTRIAQENTRVSQETARVNAENTRKNQEATRQANEATRVSQETNRSQAESTRNSNETVRQNQENIRKNQEQARVTAEGNRVTSENVRVSAEQARVLKEQERQAIEVERQNSESTREQQEAIRVSQENTRKQADILRQQEHESRQQFLDGFEGKLNTIADDVATIKDDVVSVKEANKRQDVFLQGLYNENLDGRVTVKEEGSVISLTNSADGLVDVVGLEGNTLVNYVQDGAKELNLNGDIEAEGTNVTLTEGVDGGKVDVMCEGNTLINLTGVYENPVSGSDVTLDKTKYTFTMPNNAPYTGAVNVFVNGIKPNTEYTIIANITKNTLTKGYLILANDEQTNFANKTIRVNPNELGIKKYLVTSKNEIPAGATIRSYLMGANEGEQITIGDYILLEGDWTNKEIPSEYFEGMKSVGECEDNKIEIVTRGKNLFDKSKATPGFILNTNLPTNSYDAENLLSDYIPVKPNTKYFYSFKGYTVGTGQYDNTTWTGFLFYTDRNEYSYIGSRGVISASDEMFVTSPSNAKYIRIGSRFLQQKNVTVQFVESDVVTEYTPYVLNKKEITLSEPLRALPGGVKDKVVKVGGKCYFERNCGEIVLDGNNAQFNSLSFNNGVSKFYYFITSKKVGFSNVICDKLPTLNSYASDPNIVNGISGTGNNGAVWISLETNATTKEELKDEFNNNPLTLIYELTSPIYEEITEPTLNTYNDTTHISNNSTIPCNMKVTNTGYNAIIKPSTQYTVAFDTDKSGEVGINLGGSKVTTTNSVATVTTPSTLVDDALRLTGKGIKASKVRLLEGDKTNWIPSYFEGMKSSFEDKLQEDGTYKMEILSNNKNLFDVIFKENILKAPQLDIRFKDGKILVNGSMQHHYMFKVVIPKGTYFASGLDNNLFLHVFWQGGDSGFISNKRSVTYLMDTEVQCYLSRGEYTNYECSFQLELGETTTDFIPSISNKIQFSSIEPLRGVGDAKDRFVFKNGKLMIERNIKERIYNGSEPWSITTGVDGTFKYVTISDNFDIPSKILFDNQLNSKYIVENPYNLIKNSFWLLNNGGHKQVRFSLNGTETDVEIYKQALRENNVKVAYIAESPTYEEIPFELQKIILEGYENGTLFFDTNIPPTVEASYTANIPVVNELNKNSNEIVVTQEDLSVTQVAVDFLLMSNIGEEMLSGFNLNTRGRNSMGAYFANRITKGALRYEDVISKYPQYKEEIDSILETK